MDERRAAVVSGLGPIGAQTLYRRVASLVADHAVERMWNIDPSLWTNDEKGQAEISIRLGWLNLPETSRPAVKDINTFAAHAHEAGFTHFLLLGMGGSSLAPEVISQVFSPLSFPLFSEKMGGDGGGKIPG